MKKLLKRLLLLSFAVAMIAALTSCDLSRLPIDIPGLTDKAPDGGDEDKDQDQGGDEVELEGLVLIKGAKAQFKVVHTTDSGSASARAADGLVTKLRALGIEVDDPVNDRYATDVSEIEVVIGTNARHRGDDCSVSDKYLGAEGYCIKVVGNRVVIAGGSAEMTSKAADSFVSSILKITSKTKEGDVDNLAIPYETFQEKLTTYLLSSISIGGVDLKEYTLVLDVAEISEEYELEAINSFRNDLYDEAGYWLDLGDPEHIDEYGHKIVLRYTKDIPMDKDGHGFIIYVDDQGDLYVECGYANAFDKSFAKMIEKLIFKNMGSVDIPKSYKDTDKVSVAYYSDFGAKGDGKTDDFEAIYNTHIYANAGGQKVMGAAGAKYYIGEKFTREIPVMTDTDLCGATVIVDDTTSTAYASRKNALYHMARTNPVRGFEEAALDELVGTDRKISVGDTSIDWIVPLLECKSLVRVYNKNHRDFVRWGANQNSGAVRTDIFVINEDGTLEEDIVVAYEFDTVTSLNIWRTDDAPIVFENGNFETICCKTVPETGYIAKFHEYYRGFKIYRTNTTLRNIKHTMVDEPDLNIDATTNKVGEEKLETARFGTRDESYPYYGFYYVLTSYNSRAENMILDGHTTYYEDKPFTASVGKVPDPVPMGSYDIVIEYSSRTYLNNVIQQDNGATGLADSRYWGIMSSNGSKNISYIGCEINRFDAHRGFWNATLIDTTIGHSFNIIGGGKLYCERVTKLASDNFMIFRADYGATFHGDIEIIDCEHKAYAGYNTARKNGGQFDPDKKQGMTYIINADYDEGNSGSIVYKKDADGNVLKDANGEPIVELDGRYYYWNFGYTTYMPTTVKIKNFKAGTKNQYVFNELPDDVFGDIPNQYQITKTITFIGDGKTYPTCPNIEKNRKMANIKVVYEQ